MYGNPIHFIAWSVCSKYCPKVGLDWCFESLRLPSSCSNTIYSIMSQACCSGHLHEGDAVGKVTKIGGVDAYVTGEKSSKVLVILPDIFGYNLNNTKLLADYYAKEAKVTVYIPDTFGGKSVPVEVLKDGWLSTFDFPTFIAAHPKDKRYAEVVAFIKELKEKHGVTHVGALGVCWGGWTALYLSRDKLIDIAALAHPSFVETADVESISTPTLWLCATHDGIFTKEKRAQAQDILDTKTQYPAKFVTYPGTEHGFAVRGDSKVNHVRIAAEDAAQQVVLFLKRYFEL